MKKKDKCIRILHVTEMLSAAGIESYIMNNYRRINRELVQFDFLVLRNQNEFYDEEIAKLGGKKFCIVSNKKNTFLKILDESKKIENFLKQHSYDIVHIHYTTPLRAPYLLAAKRAGVKIRIYHAHSAYVSGKSKLKYLVYNIMRKKITKWGTHFFACSKAAAEWMFEKNLLDENKVKIIHNGIDLKKFMYDETVRTKIRKKLDIKNEFVLINTGRFTEQKNQSFIIDVFEKLYAQNPNTILLLLGTGCLLEDVKNKVEDLKLEGKVKFLGVKQNVSEYLCAADCYIMPSLYEGLPVAAIEAESTGLPCVFSTNITKEVALTNETEFLPLSVPVDKWTQCICKYYNYDRTDKSVVIREKGYDVQTLAIKLQNFYLTGEFYD